MPSFLAGRSGIVVLVLFVLFALGSQILFLPYIELAHGLGYDGIWYHPPALNFLGKVDNYHLFRILPSKIAYLIRELLDLDNQIGTTVRIFQVENLVFVGLTIWVLFKISAIKSYSGFQRMLFFIFCLFNFSVFKEFAFNPVMTDAMGFFLSTLIYWLHLKKSMLWLILALLASLFCMPIIPVFYLLWFLLESLENKTTEPIELPVFERYFPLIPIGVGLAFAGVSSIIVLYFKRVSVYTFPDEINLFLFPATLICNFVALWAIISRFKSFFLQGFFIALRPFQVLKNKWFLILLGFLIFQNRAAHFNNHFMIGYSGLFVGYPIILNLKPLIGIVDNLNFYGPVLFLFLISFFHHPSGEKRPMKQDFLFLIFFLIILKPEARHSLFLIPLISATLLESNPIHIITGRFTGIVAVLAIIYSKFWYPTHWAHFPPPHLLFSTETNQKIYQEFPVQHYFMFQGPMMAHGPYFAFLAINLAVGYFLWNEFFRVRAIPD